MYDTAISDHYPTAIFFPCTEKITNTSVTYDNRINLYSLKQCLLAIDDSMLDLADARQQYVRQTPCKKKIYHDEPICSWMTNGILQMVKKKKNS